MAEVVWFSRVREKRFCAAVRNDHLIAPPTGSGGDHQRPSLYSLPLRLSRSQFAALEFVPHALGCNIKGNIAHDTGERIYHLPKDDYYWETSVNWLRGERYFCSEKEAREAGWRKARM